MNGTEQAIAKNVSPLCYIFPKCFQKSPKYPEIYLVTYPTFAFFFQVASTISYKWKPWLESQFNVKQEHYNIHHSCRFSRKQNKENVPYN